MPRSYVNNSMNRSLGRVGMSVGSMPVSRGSGGGGGGFSGSGFGGSGSSSSSGTSTRAYVDNAYNRSHGRVGEPVGSHVISKTTGSGSKQPAATTEKVYADNAYNRSHGRAGEPLGSKVISKKTPSCTEPTAQGPEGKVYKDNRTNQRLGRVGKEIGTAVYSAKTKTTVEKVYKDNKENRERGRVGKPRGSMPSKNKSTRTKAIKDTASKIETGEEIETDERNLSLYDGFYVDDYDEAVDQAIFSWNRIEEEAEWKIHTRSRETPKTQLTALQNYFGQKISFGDIELGKKIGSGGFGEVYFAKWKGTIVAVKKMHNEGVSNRRLKEFEEEVIKFNELDHPNIVRFIGASVERPNLCIVMEYMHMSLFEAIHVKEVDLEESERLDIMRQTSNGLKYLHSKPMAHCDLKTTNVLMSSEIGKMEVKLSDFGLSSMKSNTETSSSCAKLQAFTLRYSAPEILRAERLPSVEDKMRADIYSLSLIFFEVVFEDEPFYDFNIPQLMKNVGEKGVSPEIPEKPTVSINVKNILENAWCNKPEKRPTVVSICDSLQTLESIYGN
ncbi:uncharacterized protein LOC123531482 [Mercenaria mercenaria]|uniref:uncharacterized protein LOC123531482 n=1 Tax=Mercenaria mercenaria TaxID=6596 RepID=UPI001E1D9283|nr:uncharacterized protein LOC123531482 [Mercenaria mercenaria]XP_045168433.1 uncharacterized protein LOC123531482 [Mercenaria mercenaria]